jgi:phage/plasmid-like protein (TIGR03299 family)
MSAIIDSLINIPTTPWAGLGTTYENVPKSSQEIIEGAKLNWDVGATRMFTSLHERVRDYHAIYREDNNDVLGVVNIANPRIVQNTDTFNALTKLIQSDEITIDTASSLGLGEKVFGTFKINEKYKVFDDEIEHYLVVFNDHLKPDGKVTILNTPIRVVCQNTLSAALSSNCLKYRISCPTESVLHDSLAKNILEATQRSKFALTNKAEILLQRKVSRDDIEIILDELFPYIKTNDGSSHQKANDTTAMIRDTFVEKCLYADNLANYDGTQYQVFNALTDFTGHYYKNAEYGLDIDKRMNLLPGMGGESQASLVTKFLKMSDKLAA